MLRDVSADGEGARVQEVDKAVNEYPGERTFTFIGEASPGFTTSMIGVIETAVQFKVHEEAVRVRPSSTGKYHSVKVGPVVVSTPEQVKQIFNTAKADSRLKWFL